MTKTLVLLTNYFPYYKGEEYLESELPILAKYYSKIILLPLMVPARAKQTRRVPANVQVLLSQKDSKKLRVKMIGQAIASKVLQDHEVKSISFIQKFYSRYFEARALNIYQSFKKELLTILRDDKNIDIYSYWLYLTARVGLEIKKDITGKKSVFFFTRTHRYDLYEDVAPLKMLPQREYLLSNLDMIYPVSEDGKAHLYENYPQFENKYKVQRLGTINHGRIDPIKQKPVHLVSCSALRPVKRVNLIIDALAILQKKGMDVCWTHLGDGKEMAKLKRKASRELKEGSYRFLGALSNQEVFDYYLTEKPSIFINVSESEGVPVSIMEAMSVGLPIIATDVGGTREIVQDHSNGFLLKKDFQVAELVDILSELQSSTSLIEQMSASSYRIWQDKCDSQKLYHEFVEMIFTYSKYKRG